MGWLKKKKDPLSEREQSLRTEIERLEAQIRDLSAAGAGASKPVSPATPQVASAPASVAPTTAPRDPAQPRLRSTALPGGQVATRTAAPSPNPPTEQVFEQLDHKRLQTPPEAANKALYNELGVRKYDLPGAWRRVRSFFHGSTAQNQTLVKLLAAGNIQGLRPLRYEKRVARRRFLIFVVVLFLLLWGIIAMFLRR